MAVFVLLVVVALSFRGISKPFLALMALLTVYIIQPGELYPSLGSLHLERVLVLLVFATCLFHGEKFRFPKITKRYLWFYGAMLLSIPFAFWRGGAAYNCEQYLEIVCFHIFIVALLTTEERIRQFVVALVGLTAWLGASALYMYHQGVEQVAMGIERAVGITSAGGDANTLGITLAIMMPMEFLLMAKGNPKWMRVFGLGVLALSLATIITTGSRTSFFTFLALLMILLLRSPKNLKFIPVLALGLPLLWVVIPQQYKARYETVNQLQDDESYQNRVLSWRGGVQMFLSNPVTGVGPGNYTYANGTKFWPGIPRHWLNAHSLYFQLLGELGSVGILTFGSYVICLFVLNRRTARTLKERGASVLLRQYPGFCNASLYLLLLTGYSAHNLYRNTWALLGAISAAVSLLPPAKAAVPVMLAAETRALPAWAPGAEEETDAAPTLV
jgi:O-antigen ligase